MDGRTKQMKTIKAICLDCYRTDGELKIMTTTRQLSMHGKFNPTHRVQIISAGDYDRKTGFCIKVQKK